MINIIYNNKGITLVEIVASIVILGIVIAGFSIIYSYAFRTISSSENTTAANANIRAISDNILFGAEAITTYDGDQPITEIVNFGDKSRIYPGISVSSNPLDIVIRLNGAGQSEVIIENARHFTIAGHGDLPQNKVNIIIPPGQAGYE